MHTGIPQNGADHYRHGIGEFASSEDHEANSVRSCRDADLFGFLLADYDRRREVGQWLSEISNDQSSQLHIDEAIDYLSKSFSLHLRIEEEALFPMLRRDCRPEDNIPGLIDHACGDDRLILSHGEIVELLYRAKQDKTCSQDDAEKVCVFAKQLKERAAFLSAAIIPIARVRFDEAALVEFTSRVNAIRIENNTGEHP